MRRLLENSELLKIQSNNIFTHMMEKTGCESRTELAIEARLSGVVVYMEDQ